MNFIINQVTVSFFPLKLVLYVARADGGGPETTLPLILKVPPWQGHISSFLELL